MSEKKIEIKGPNLPLDPIVGEADPEYPEIKGIARMMKLARA